MSGSHSLNPSTIMDVIWIVLLVSHGFLFIAFCCIAKYLRHFVLKYNRDIQNVENARSQTTSTAVSLGPVGLLGPPEPHRPGPGHGSPPNYQDILKNQTARL